MKNDCKKKLKTIFFKLLVIILAMLLQYSNISETLLEYPNIAETLPE